MADKRYFIDQDDAEHWYLIEAKRRSDWEEWKSQDWRSDLSNFQTPSYAKDIDLHSYITFTDPLDES